jgi:hypothetical protein
MRRPVGEASSPREAALLLTLILVVILIRVVQGGAAVLIAPKSAQDPDLAFPFAGLRLGAQAPFIVAN